MKNIAMYFGVLLVAPIYLSSCGGEGDKKGKGTFPSFYGLTKEASPQFASGATLAPVNLSQFRVAQSTEMPAVSTIDSNWPTVASTSQNLIGQVLLDAGQSGPVKSMFVLLAQADASTNTINSDFSDEDGNLTECTAIAATTSLTTPFFATAGKAPFNEFNDAGKYTCYESNGTSGFLAAGKHAVANPTATCADPNEYYVLSSSGSEDQPNSELVAERGETVSGVSVQKYYYNGCTGDIRLYYAQGTLYASGVSFSSRTELSGNTQNHTFNLKVAYKDILSATNGMFISVVGSGQSKKTAATDPTASFWMGYKETTCSDSTTCASPKGVGNYCVTNDSTGNSYTVADSIDSCADQAADYTALTPLEIGDIPHAYFDGSPTAAGL